jgi:hypothetical protein
VGIHDLDDTDNSASTIYGSNIRPEPSLVTEFGPDTGRVPELRFGLTRGANKWANF